MVCPSERLEPRTVRQPDALGHSDHGVGVVRVGQLGAGRHGDAGPCAVQRALTLSPMTRVADAGGR